MDIRAQTDPHLMRTLLDAYDHCVQSGRRRKRVIRHLSLILVH